MKRPARLEYSGTGFKVILAGFPVYEDDGEVFPNVGPIALHRVIARALLSRPGLLTGADLSFLRAHADLTRSECARRLKITRRTLIPWEDSGKKRIAAPPLKHVSLKVFFAKQLFPQWTLPEAATRLPSSVSREPIFLEFRSLRNRLQPPLAAATAMVAEGLQCYLRGNPLKIAA